MQTSKYITTIGFVGAGPTNFAGIYKLLQNLEHHKSIFKVLKIKLDIFEMRQDNFWGGRAFREATPEMLFNDDLRELLRRDYGDHSQIVSQFVNWLNDNPEKWLKVIRECDDPAAKKWLQTYRKQISERNFHDIHLPRMTFGLFLEDLFAKVLKKAEALGVEINPIVGEVSKIEKAENNRSLCTFKEPATVFKATLKGDKVEYKATNRELTEIMVDDVSLCPGFSQRIDFPALKDNINYYKNHMEAVTRDENKLRDNILRIYEANGNQKVDIAFIGSGASFMDLITHLDIPDIKDKVRITCYSMHGHTPIAIYEEEKQLADTTEYKPKYITPESNFTTKEELYKALENEIREAKHFGLTRASAFYQLRDWHKAHEKDSSVNEAVKEAGLIASRLKFTTIYAAQCRENLDVEEVKIYFDKDGVAQEGNKITLQANGKKFTSDILINSSGVGLVQDFPIIAEMVKSGEVKVSKKFPSKGIVVDKHLEARPGLYVAGSAATAREVEGEDGSHIPNVNQYTRDGYIIADSLTEKIIDRARRAAKALGAELY